MMVSGPQVAGAADSSAGGRACTWAIRSSVRRYSRTEASAGVAQESAVTQSMGRPVGDVDRQVNEPGVLLHASPQPAVPARGPPPSGPRRRRHGERLGDLRVGQAQLDASDDQLALLWAEPLKRRFVQFDLLGPNRLLERRGPIVSLLLVELLPGGCRPARRSSLRIRFMTAWRRYA
jgi:hypothetical protein